MNRRSAAAITITVGLLSSYLASSEDLLLFVRPSMRPWLLLAGALLVTAGAAAAAFDLRRRQAQSTGHGFTAVGLLLLVPVGIAALAPAAVGEYAASRSRSFQQRTYQLDSFDLERYLAAQEITGGTPSLPVLDYLSATADPAGRRYLSRHGVRVTAFTMDGGGARHTMLTRMVVGCCAADALPVRLEADLAGHPKPRDGQWVTATVRLLHPARGDRPPSVRVEAIHPTSEPDRPYEYRV